MIGTTLKARTGITLGVLLCLLVGSTLAILGTTTGHQETDQPLLLASVWPFSMALMLYLLNRRRFHAELKENSIQVTEPKNEEIPYSSIVAVQRDANGTKTRRALFVHHAKGILAIPEHAGVKSNELQEFLQRFVPPGSREELPTELQRHLDVFRAKFGAERVFAFTPRRNTVRSDYARFGRAMGLTCIITGIAWGVLSPLLQTLRFNSVGWVNAGVFLFFIGVVLFWLFTMMRRLPGGQKKWQSSGLVVSPLGLSLIQGKMRGEMKWEELKNLIYPTKKQFFDAGNKAGNIRLDFGGGGVDVIDIYCQPLQVIHERMKAYWQQ